MNKQPRLYKWELLFILWVAYFLNQGDRQIYNAVLPLIKADLKVSDVELGMVATGVHVALAVCLCRWRAVSAILSRRNGSSA